MNTVLTTSESPTPLLPDLVDAGISHRQFEHLGALSLPKALEIRKRTWILALAFTLRLCVSLYALAHFGAQWFFTRGLEMGFLADSLVHGRGFSSPFGPPTGPTAMIAPGYPFLVAGVFRVFGSYSFLSALTLIGLNLLFNVLTVWLIMQLARRLANERCALIAGCFWACSLPLLWVPTIFWETSLSSFLLLGSIAFGLELREGRSDLSWLLYGVYGAVSGLLNPALLPCLALVATWAFLNSRPQLFRRPLLAAILFLLIYSPWPARNFRVFHAWIPTRTTVSLELWMGNHAGSDGYLQEALFPSYNPKELGEYKAEGEVAYMSSKASIATGYIRNHPARFLYLTALRVLRFWSGAGTRNGSLVFLLHATTTSLLGFFGLYLLFRSKQRSTALLFALALAAFPLPYYLTHAEFRYRIVLDPLMTVLAAVALERAGQWIREADRGVIS